MEFLEEILNILATLKERAQQENPSQDQKDAAASLKGFREEISFFTDGMQQLLKDIHLNTSKGKELVEASGVEDLAKANADLSGLLYKLQKEGQKEKNVTPRKIITPKFIREKLETIRAEIEQEISVTRDSLENIDRSTPEGKKLFNTTTKKIANLFNIDTTLGNQIEKHFTNNPTLKENDSTISINLIEAIESDIQQTRKGTTLYSGLAFLNFANLKFVVNQTKILATKAGRQLKKVAKLLDNGVTNPTYKVRISPKETTQSVHTSTRPNITSDQFVADANKSFVSTSPLVKTKSSTLTRTATNSFKGGMQAFISRGGIDMTGIYLINTAISPFTRNPNIIRNVEDFSSFITAPLECFVHNTKGTPLGVTGTTSLIIRHYMSHAVQSGKFVLVKAGTTTTATANVLKETGSVLRNRVFQATVQGSRFILATAGTAEAGMIACVAIPAILVTDALVNAPTKNAASATDILHLYKNHKMNFNQALSAMHSGVYNLEEGLPSKTMLFMPYPCELPRLTTQTEISFNNGFGNVVLVAFNTEKGMQINTLKGPIPSLRPQPIMPNFSVINLAPPPSKQRDNNITSSQNQLVLVAKQ